MSRNVSSIWRGSCPGLSCRRWPRRTSNIIATKWSSLCPPGLAGPGARGEGGALALGLHVGAAFDRIFNLEQCFLQSLQSTAIVAEVRRWCGHSGLAAYNPTPIGVSGDFW